MHPYSVKRVTLLLLATLVTAGCATTASPPDDRDQVVKVVQEWKRALLANNITQLMALYSENFTSEFGNKAVITAEMADMAQRMADQDGRLNLEDADVVVNGDRASVKPITIGTRKGAVCRSLYLSRENGRWLIVEMGRK